MPAGSPSHRALPAHEETEALIRREGLASAEALLDWYIRYEFPPDALLTVAASDRTQREVADFWTKLGNLHQRRTGRPLRTGAVRSGSRVPSFCSSAKRRMVKSGTMRVKMSQNYR